LSIAEAEMVGFELAHVWKASAAVSILQLKEKPGSANDQSRNALASSKDGMWLCPAL